MKKGTSQMSPLLTLVCLFSVAGTADAFAIVPVVAGAGAKVWGGVLATKAYGAICWTVAKPFVVATAVKSVWLPGVSVAEWSAGYLYATNCVGSGFSGWWSHIWSIGSPACVSLLTTHVALMGVFLASVLCTIGGWILWASSQVKEDPTSRAALEEFKRWKAQNEGYIHQKDW